LYTYISIEILYILERNLYNLVLKNITFFSELFLPSFYSFDNSISTQIISSDKKKKNKKIYAIVGGYTRSKKKKENSELNNTLNHLFFFSHVYLFFLSYEHIFRIFNLFQCIKRFYGNFNNSFQIFFLYAALSFCDVTTQIFVFLLD